MRDIIVYGAGGFGRETALMIHQINVNTPTWNILGFCDDNVVKGTVINGLPVLGGLSELNSASQPVAVVLALSDPLIRKEVKSKIQNLRVEYPTIIHPTVQTGDAGTNRIGVGSIITAGNILTTNIDIGEFVIINLACTIGHDVIIHAFSSIMPGCSISGAVTIESDTFIGTGARILQGLTLSNASKVGAGSVVTQNVPPNTTVAGVPAKPLLRK